MSVDWNAIEAEAAAQLAKVGGISVDLERLRGHSADLASGRLGPEANRFREDPRPANATEVDASRSFSAADRQSYLERGREALERGQVAVAVLNGGMATRFGGGVKGVVEAVAGRSFLAVKHAQAARRGPIPFLVMNSFATQRATLEHLAKLRARDVHPFLQGVSVRLTPSGDLFREPSGALSLYAPGHGDFPEALRVSGLLGELTDRGVRTVMLSNVDNLGADPDPLIVGYHLAHGRPLTCEVAPTLPGDVGGAPAWVGDRLQVVEGFRFSPSFDFATLQFLSANTFLFAPEALEVEHPLTWFYVEKEVDGRRAVQIERLVNELSRFVPTAFLATPRGLQGRFLPIKSPADLEAFRAEPAFVERFSAV